MDSAQTGAACAEIDCRYGRTVGLERVKGIEPSYAAWEAAVLPLNYTRVAGDSMRAREAASCRIQVSSVNPDALTIGRQASLASS